MLTTIAWSLIIISVLIILTIVVRKFPALAILNISEMPGEKEAKFKEQIIEKRVRRDLHAVSGFLGRLWLALSKRFSRALNDRQAKLKKLRTNYSAALRMPWHEKQRKIRELAVLAEEAWKKEDENNAEEKLVEIISLDAKNLEAFFQLANLYRQQKKWPEARETYEYALRLSRQARLDGEENGEITTQEIYFSLAETEKEAGDIETALENVREALELEANNPRYLDLILDLSIMKKDKGLAEEFWARLSVVNPENNKLMEWRNRIDNLD